VVVLVGAANEKRDGDVGVKVLGHARLLKVALRVKDHLVRARRQHKALGHECCGHAAVAVGEAVVHEAPLARDGVQRVELNAHVGGGCAARGVEDVRRDGRLVRGGHGGRLEMVLNGEKAASRRRHARGEREKER
jgi:hypothetical protein